jgi:hypothetical protein
VVAVKIEVRVAFGIAKDERTSSEEHIEASFVTVKRNFKVACEVKATVVSGITEESCVASIKEGRRKLIIQAINTSSVVQTEAEVLLQPDSISKALGEQLVSDHGPELLCSHLYHHHVLSAVSSTSFYINPEPCELHLQLTC